MMKRFVVAWLLWAASTAVLAQAPAASPAPPSVDSEYELVVGGTSYPVGLDEQVEVAAGAEKVTVKLQRRKTRAFTGFGISFQFPGEMNLKKPEEENELVTITLDHPQSPLVMIQVFPPEVQPAEVPKSLLDGLAQEFKTRQARPSKLAEKASRKFGETARGGEAVEYVVAAETIRVEAYAWKQGDRTVAVTLQHATDEASVAEAAFAVITGSLK